MGNLNLEQVLRYLIIGYIIIGLYVFIDPNIGINTFYDSGNGLNFAEISILALVIGSIYFSIYRAIIYENILFPFIDIICRKNARNWLMNKYKISRREAIVLQKTIQGVELKDNLGSIYVGSAQTQLLFMTAIACFLFFVISISLIWDTISGIYFLTSLMEYICLKNRIDIYQELLKSFALLSVGMFILVAAIRSDCYLTPIERGFIRSVDPEKIKEYYEKIKCEKGHINKSTK